MTRMEEEAKTLGADGVVGVRLDVEMKEFGADIAEFIAVGTAIARVSRSEQRHSGPTLAIMSLDPQRRQAARIRI